MSGYDPQRRRRLTTRANTTAVEALLDGEPTRSRRRVDRPAGDERNPGPVARDLRQNSRISDEEPPAEPLEARSGCLSALLTLRRR